MDDPPTTPQPEPDPQPAIPDTIIDEALLEFAREGAATPAPQATARPVGAPDRMRHGRSWFPPARGGVVIRMAFNPARAISLLRNGGHTETQAQAVVEIMQDSHEEFSTQADLDQLRLAMQADLREQTAELKMLMAEMKMQMAELKIWTLKLVLAQTALIVTIAVGAVVVGGVLWG